MFALPQRSTLQKVALIAILIPLMSLSQVKIKEKIEIQPKPPTQAKQLAGAYDFFAPPLFIPDDCTLPLKSTLFITGTVGVSDNIGYGQSVEVGYVVHDYFNPSVIYDTPIAWKGRNLVPAGGNLFEGQKPDTLTLEAGTTPDVELLLWRTGFDGFGTSQVTGGVSALDFSFTGTRTKIDGSPAPVSGTAHVAGAVVPTAAFNSWKIQGWTYLWCGDQAPLTITPLDSSGAQYSPAHSEMMSGTFTVSVQAKGDYAYLQYDVQQGKQVTVTIPQQNTIYLVLDTQRGYIPDDVDTAIVTVTGGGKSKSMSFFLGCPTFDHLTVLATSDTLRCGTSVGLKVVAQDIFNREITPPDSFNVTLELWYQGTLLVEGVAVAHDTSISYTLAHSGRLRYVAPDSSNDGMECGDVWIDVYRTEDWGMWGYTDLTFAKSYCVTVTPSRTKLAPGDTAMLSFDKTGGQDMYDVAILTADTSNCGRLESSSAASGIALQADRGTVRYIAPKSITGDSIVVQIKAFSYGICDNIPIHGIIQDVASTLSKRASAMQMKKKVSVTKSQKTVKSGRMLYAGVKRRLTSSEQKALTMSIAKRTLDGICPLVPAQVVVENTTKIPAGIALQIDPPQVVGSGTVKLIVKLKDENGILIQPGETAATVAYKLGSEAAEMGALNSNTGPFDLAGVPYDNAFNGAITAALDKKIYDGRFPFLISVKASSDPAGSANDEITLVAPHTTGVRYFMDTKPWGSQIYDDLPELPMGNEKNNFSNHGCAITVMAMIGRAVGSDVDPGKLHDWMKAHGRLKGGRAKWDAISSYDQPAKLVSMATKGAGFDRTTIDEAVPVDNNDLDKLLSAGCLVMAEVKNPYHTTEGLITPHYVLITGKVGTTYSILDPDAFDQHSAKRERHTTLNSFANTVYKLIPYKLTK